MVFCKRVRIDPMEIFVLTFAWVWLQPLLVVGVLWHFDIFHEVACVLWLRLWEKHLLYFYHTAVLHLASIVSFYTS